MTRFSKQFEINGNQATLDFVDVEHDIPLYIDPYALTTKDNEWAEECNNLIVSFFEELLNAVEKGDKEKAIQLLVYCREPSETHLGVSKDGNKGRGIGPVQARQIVEALVKTTATRSGLLEDISDLALFIPNIGPDKISDLTTNLIRRALITYTHDQCVLHSVPVKRFPLSSIWNSVTRLWESDYATVPYFNNKPILLVPRYSVRYQVHVNAKEFRRFDIYEYLQDYHLNLNTSLVRVIKKKGNIVERRPPTKAALDDHYPSGKEFLAEFSVEHPDILDRYRDRLKEAGSKVPNINPENFDECEFSKYLISEYSALSPGPEDATKYHHLCSAVLSFLFYPNIICPKVEKSVNQGRKRIDIYYTNAKEGGFFYRAGVHPFTAAHGVHVECKNYSKDINNPELDQLIGRFDDRCRGRFGLMCFRTVANEIKLIQKCIDAKNQGLGVILPLSDKFFIQCLSLVSEGRRSSVDGHLENLYQSVIS